jgi:hypothetical protein
MHRPPPHPGNAYRILSAGLPELESNVIVPHPRTINLIRPAQALSHDARRGLIELLARFKEHQHHLMAVPFADVGQVRDGVVRIEYQDLPFVEHGEF